MKRLSDKLATQRILVSDGAWGTLLQAKGLQPEECPESWNLTNRDRVLEVAREYVDAGADMILTNSFGGTRMKLNHYGLAEKASDCNRAAAEISCEAAGDSCLVLGSIGPSGVILMTGEVSEQQLWDAFAEQAVALAQGGVDALCIETMSALDEAGIAVKAAKENTTCEIINTFTFEKSVDGTYHTMMGVTPTQAAVSAIENGADIIGSNCGNGIEGMVDIVKEMKRVKDDIPILIHANAGLPKLVDGNNVFPESPQHMAEQVPKLIRAGARIIGGCCGTTPAHISAIAEAVRDSMRKSNE